MCVRNDYRLVRGSAGMLKRRSWLSVISMIVIIGHPSAIRSTDYWSEFGVMLKDASGFVEKLILSHIVVD